MMVNCRENSDFFYDVKDGNVLISVGGIVVCGQSSIRRESFCVGS